MDAKRIRKLIKEAPVGKKVGGDLYMVPCALEGELRDMYDDALLIAKNRFSEVPFDLVKISPKNKVSFLVYPNFMNEPHPAIASYITVDLTSGEAKQAFYRDPSKAFVLHRKETMIPTWWECYQSWAAFSQQEEKAGLLKNPPGQQTKWKAFLKEKGFRLEGFNLVAE